MDDEAAERIRHTRLVEDAVARGQTALGAGDRATAARWLDRAHRLASHDGTITLLLASALLARDNARAAALFAEVLAAHDVRDAWLGLATARALTGDWRGASTALVAVLSRHASRPDVAMLADQVVRATGAAGWCGLTAGVVAAYPARPGAVEIRIDGDLIDGNVLPAGWPRARQITVLAGSRSLLGSPISTKSIGQVEGHVEATEIGLRGWAWCPGDPDADPRLVAGSGRSRQAVPATAEATAVSGLRPLARPRSFAVGWAEVPAGSSPVRVRGRDGRDLRGSPMARTDAGPKDRPAPPVTTAAVVTKASRRLSAAGRRGGSVILITHDDGGGVERRVQAAAGRHAALGRSPIVLRPTRPSDGAAGVLAEGAGFPATRFELPRQRPALIDQLHATRPAEVELHHFLNHDPSVFQIARDLGVPYDVHIHDFTWFCPRVALVGRGGRYCGEPETRVCETCVAELGGYLHEDITVAALLQRSRDCLSAARQVIAPSRDAADRIRRHFPGIAPIVIPHEDDASIEDPPPIPTVTGPVLVCVAGAIGLHKGFHVLLDCANDAGERALELNFVVAGTTIDDQRLIDTGKVFVTGPYHPGEAVDLIKAQSATLAFLPSIWPETWCLGLTELWRAGLRVAAFDIGAPAERISATGRGFLLPLGMPPAAINDTLLKAAGARSFLPIRAASAYKPPIDATTSK